MRTQNRREFLRKVSLTTLSIPILGSCASGQTRSSSDVGRIKNNADRSGAIWSGAKDAPNDVTSYSKLANENENGERLIISGTVFMHDGKAPAPNILIYAYHTDIKGIYGKGNEPTHGRFRGWMLTDSKGRYEIDTIKPGPYPTGGTPAHIHYTLTGISFKEDWVDSVLFKGDGRSRKVLGTPSSIEKLSMEAAKQFHEREYVFENARILIIGDFTQEDVRSALNAGEPPSGDQEISEDSDSSAVPPTAFKACQTVVVKSVRTLANLL